MNEKTKVVNRRHHPFDVYIGRPGKWGNPFIVGKDGIRDEVIRKYEAWLNLPEQVKLKASITTELKGKTLGCYCNPSACHGDVLARIAEEQGD